MTPPPVPSGVSLTHRHTFQALHILVYVLDIVKRDPRRIHVSAGW